MQSVSSNAAATAAAAAAAAVAAATPQTKQTSSMMCSKDTLDSAVRPLTKLVAHDLQLDEGVTPHSDYYINGPAFVKNASQPLQAVAIAYQCCT
jgi:hypothetical protein